MIEGEILNRFQMAAEMHENDKNIENQEMNGDACLAALTQLVCPLKWKLKLGF